MPSQPSLKIMLVKSPIGQKQRQKDTVRALGIRKMHQTVVRPDNPQMRGMVFAIKHLVTVEEIAETTDTGMCTRPKLTAPFQIERGMDVLLLGCPLWIGRRSTGFRPGEPRSAVGFYPRNDDFAVAGAR